MEKTAEEQYVDYVVEQVEYFNKQMKLVDEGGNPSPEYINSCLTNLFPMTSGIVGELERLRLYNTKLTRNFQTWWDDKYVITQNKLKNDGRTKSNPPSQMECSTHLKVDFKEKYSEWMDAIEISEAKVSFLQGILSTVKKMDSTLASLSNNMRSEFYCLGSINRVNNSVADNDEKQTRRRKLKD